MAVPLAGGIIRASDAVTAWTAYTPTLTQSATVTKTVSVARYTRIGNLVTVGISLTVTGAGTASNGVVVGLPLTALAGTCFGAGYIFDTSASLFYAGIAYPTSTTTFGLLIGSGTGVGNVAGAPSGGFTAALAAGDLISFNLSYEAA